MSETTSPIGAMFDLQRSAIEQTHEAFKRGVETQREFGESVVGFGSVTEANERGYEALHTFVDVYFDALESVTPGQETPVADVRASVDEGLDALETTQTEVIEQFETVDSDDPFEEFVAALDETFEALLEAHDDVADRTVEAFEGFEGDFESLQATFEVDEVADPFGEHVARMQEQVQNAVERQVEMQVEATDALLDSTPQA